MWTVTVRGKSNGGRVRSIRSESELPGGVTWGGARRSGYMLGGIDPPPPPLPPWRAWHLPAGIPLVGGQTSRVGKQGERGDQGMSAGPQKCCPQQGAKTPGGAPCDAGRNFHDPAVGSPSGTGMRMQRPAGHTLPGNNNGSHGRIERVRAAASRQ